MNINKILGQEILDNALKSDVKIFDNKVELNNDDIDELNNLFNI